MTLDYITLTPEELAKGQAYFKSESLLTGDITLDSLLSMTENGWCTWERNADGALLPTAGGSVTPEEPDYFAGGDGSVGDPYQIATEAQLRAFAEATQAGKLVTTNVYFVLTADIALNGEWTPVHSFGGTFDGGDHTVSGMTIGTAEAPSTLVSAGFFDVLANTAKHWLFEDLTPCGWKQAQTTGGGLSLTELEPSFQFKGCPGLYFVGETLDCAGMCGGFNLHWAFGSGITAGRDAVRTLRRPHKKR